MLICHPYIFFDEVCVQIFCPFLIRLYVLLLSGNSLVSFLVIIILDTFAYYLVIIILDTYSLVYMFYKVFPSLWFASSFS